MLRDVEPWLQLQSQKEREDLCFCVSEKVKEHLLLWFVAQVLEQKCKLHHARNLKPTLLHLRSPGFATTSPAPGCLNTRSCRESQAVLLPGTVAPRIYL